MKKLFLALALMFVVLSATQAQSYSVYGEDEIYVYEWWAYCPSPNFPDEDFLLWEVTNATCTYETQLSYHHNLLIKPTSEGHFWVSFYHPAYPVVYEELYVEVGPNPYQQPPQPPAPPTITGVSSAGIYDVESYTQPSGKQAYEWTLPSGVSHVQQYNNIKVVQFTSTGNKTIQGRYKEGGEWSSWGYKTVSVSY